jgi:hypothetical protein
MMSVRPLYPGEGLDALPDLECDAVAFAGLLFAGLLFAGLLFAAAITAATSFIIIIIIILLFTCERA